MIYVGIDDTDVVGAPGTNKLARSLIRDVAGRFRSIVAVRHQLLFDPRVPYTSKNSSASMLFEPHRDGSAQELADLLRRAMLTDPIVNSIADADAILQELLEVERDALPDCWY